MKARLIEVRGKLIGHGLQAVEVGLQASFAALDEQHRSQQQLQRRRHEIRHTGKIESDTRDLKDKIV